jgi:very-short-patch-repair endonuclease
MSLGNGAPPVAEAGWRSSTSYATCRPTTPRCWTASRSSAPSVRSSTSAAPSTRAAARTLDDLWRRRLLSGGSVAAMVDELGIQGRGGLRLARQLLDERGDDYVPPASNLESRFAEIVGRAGLPEMRRQVDSGGDRWVGRVDFRANDLPLVVEVQSETYHSALTDVRDDEVRMAALRASGYTVLEVTDAHVWHQPDEVVARIREAVRALRATSTRDGNLAAGRGPDTT